MSKIQNENIKSESELIADGGAKSQLPNDDKIYLTANSLNKTLKEAIEDNDIGGGGGVSGYIQDDSSNFENGVGGWVAYADAANTKPVDGNGGSPNVTITSQTTNILAGAASGRINKDANNRQGQGVSLDLKIDKKDRGQILTLVMPYETSVDYDDDDIQVYFYDITNSNLLFANIGQELKAGKSKHYATVQVPIDCEDLRLIFHVASTNASAYTVDIDDIQLGSIPLAFGAYQNKEIINLAGIGDFTGGKLLVTRVGNIVNLRVISTLTFSSSNDVTTPSGILPTWARSSGDEAANVTRLEGSPIVIVQFSSNSNGAIRITFRTESFASVNRTSTDRLTLTYSVDDNLSTTQISQTFSQSELYSSVFLSPSAQSVPDSTSTKININTITEESGSMFNSSFNRIEIKQSGTYFIQARARFAANSTGVRVVYAAKNGVTSDRLCSVAVGASPFDVTIPTASNKVKLEKGDYVELYVFQSSGGNLSVSASSQNKTELVVWKENSGSTLLERPTVSFFARTNSGQSVPDSTSPAIIYEDLIESTGNIDFNTTTGIATVKVPGLYKATASISFPASAGAGPKQLFIELGSQLFVFDERSDKERYTQQITTPAVRLKKGDTITVNVSNFTGSTFNLVTAPSVNYFGVQLVK